MDSQYVSQPNDTPLHFHHGRGKPPANLDNPKGLSSDEQELSSGGLLECRSQPFYGRPIRFPAERYTAPFP